MLALAVLFFIGLYLVISLTVVLFAAHWARKRGRRGWVGGGVAAFAMYNLVFWDWIPTLVMHKYYCSTQAGFWVYKTPEQWVKENPGVLETLRPYPRSRIHGDGKVGFEFQDGTVVLYNERFGSWSRWKEGLNGLPISRFEAGIVDIKSKKFLVYSVRFLSGPRDAGAVWKSWLIWSSCDEAATRRNVELENLIVEQLKMEEKE